MPIIFVTNQFTTEDTEGTEVNLVHAGTVLNKIMEYSGNVVVNLKKMIEFLRFPVIFLL